MMPSNQELPTLKLEEWIAVVVHDLRDPMNAIVGMTDLLLRSERDETRRLHLETVQDAATTACSLINDLLDVDRLRRGELRFVDEPFDLRRLVGRVLDWLRPRASLSGIDLTLDYDPELPGWVGGDPGRLRQILTNLVGNGLKFTSIGSVRLTVAPGPAGDGLRFTVDDTGRGMDAAHLARLGTPFLQGQQADEQLGLGLGLVIARHLVDAMGGRFAIESTPGRGTTVTVDLPLRAVDRPVVVGAAVSQDRHVLVIGADDGPARALVDRLGALGATVEQMADPAFVVEKLAASARPPDAVFWASGHVTADLAGMVESWRRAAATAALPIVALVQSGYRGEAEAARSAGFDGYLPLALDGVRLERALLALRRRDDSGSADFLTVHALDERGDGPWRLLVVDDNPMNVRLLQLLLERMGHAVETAADGFAAVERTRRGGLDAVLMDIQMPGLSGLEATEAIRRLEGAAGRVPIIAVTANAMPNTVGACLDAGMDACLTKPIDPHRVVGAIRRALAEPGAPAAMGEA
ncbi:MAG: response regulator [Pseudomonadota bacterium]